MNPQQPEQKSNTKAVVIVIVVIVLLLGVAIIYKMSHRTTRVATNYYQKQATVPTYTTKPTTIPSLSPTSTVSAKNTTNAQLDQDAQDIQNNLSKLDSNVTDVNQGFTNSSNDIPQ